MTETPHENTDKKDAALIAVGISNQLVSAALTFIGLVSAIVTFALGSREPTFWFYLIYIGAMLAFVASIVKGGKGSNFVKKKGEASDWRTKADDTPNYFSQQVLTLYIGIALTMVLPFTTRERKTDNSEHKELMQLLSRKIYFDSTLVKNAQRNDSAMVEELKGINQHLKALESCCKGTDASPSKPVKGS